MEHFECARTVRLRSAHGKYLWADDDMVGVSQDRECGPLVVWRVEIGDGGGFVRLRSCFDTYLTATKEAFLLGMTGKKVLQSKQVDSSTEWEPVSTDEAGNLVKLKTRHGNFLRANGVLPPWRNSVTHDVPVRTATQSWILWQVEVVESTKQVAAVSEDLSTKPKLEVQLSFKIPKSDGRRISYCVVPPDGAPAVAADANQWPSFHFKGHSVTELASSLKQELGIEEDILVCTKHAASGKLYPLQLGLPPNNAPMQVVVLLKSASADEKAPS